MTSLEGVDTEFRQSSTLLHFTLGVLSWCDALALARSQLEPTPWPPALLAESQLTEPEPPEDALLLLLGLFSFEQKLRGHLSRDAAPAQPDNTSSTEHAGHVAVEILR